MPVVDTLRQDVKGAVRNLWKSPGFAVAALITLALGIGATSAIFSVVKAVLLTDLPYAHPEQRVLIWSRWISFDKTWVADQELYDYRRLARTMTSIAAWSSGQQNLTGDGDPVRLGVGSVTANTFDVLGARPFIGRVFTEEEDRPNGPPVALLGYPLWKTRFGGDAGIVGRKILLNDRPVEVVGVMPDGFRLPTDFTDEAAEPSELWRPQQIDETQLSRSHGFYAAAILAPGHSAATATDELRTIATQLTTQGAVSGGNEVHRLRRAARRGDPWRRAAGDVAAHGRRRIPAAHRLRERRQPAARPRRRAAPRDGGAHGDWRRTDSTRPPAVHREPRARGYRRRARSRAGGGARCSC